MAHLIDPNGWWRDTAQQLLVLKQDKSVVPELTLMARTSPNQLARIHAIWTLEGLGSADTSLLRALMEDRDPPNAPTKGFLLEKTPFLNFHK